MIMPFGKYKGEDLEDIPVDYLSWILNNMEIYEPLLTDITNIIEGHKSIKYSEIKKIYWELAKKYHPDRDGGSTIEMQVINEFYELINNSMK